MIKNILVAAAILLASPAFVSAQDVFWSFSSTSATSSSSPSVGDSGSAYIFSNGPFGFDALDLNFSTSDSSVIQFTGGEAFNPAFIGLTGTRFSSALLTVDSTTNTGNLFTLNFGQNGVNPNSGPFFDPGFDLGVGPFGAVLLARVDFDIVGAGTADLNFALGLQGAIQLPITPLFPSFGSATLTAEEIEIEFEEPETTLGDTNFDGSVDCFDISPFIRVLVSRDFVDEADCNEDGAVNFLDIGPFIGFLSAP